MTMKVFVLCMVAILVAKQVQEAAAVPVIVCKGASELNSCVPAIVLGETPTPLCCGKLSEQLACICIYINDPATKPVFGSPNAKKVAATCGIDLPICAPGLVN